MKQKCRRRNCKDVGFALVLALSVMAFVLLLLTSMTIMVRVETQTSSGALDRIRAQEAARLALMVGIGELQKHAGSDQRVTARAEILGDSKILPETRHWTGVWDTTRSDTTPIWLVSGVSPDPANVDTELSTIYRPETDATDQTELVIVPNQTAPSSRTRDTNYAWWVADEGTKVNMVLPERVAPLPDEFFLEYAPKGLNAEEQNQILQQITPRRFRSETLFGDDTSFVPGATEDITTQTISDKIEEANNLLSRLGEAQNSEMLDGIDSVESQDAFFHATAFSKAVIADTDAGGLKIDLSNQGYSDVNGDFKVNTVTRDFLWSSGPDNNGQIDFLGIETAEIENLSSGDPVNTTPVLITECALYFVVSGERRNSSTARAFLRFEGEMWSPYGFRHLFEGKSDSETPELLIEFENMPDINLSYFDKDTGAYTNSTTLNFDEIRPTFDIDFTDTHKAGEIRKIAGSWPINASSDKTNFYYTENWSWSVDDPSYQSEHRGVSYPNGDSIKYQASESEIRILVKNRDGEILQQIENIPVASISADFSYYESSPSSLSQSSAPIAFYFRLRDELQDIEEWYTEKDLRSVILDFSDADILNLYDINDVDSDDRLDADFPPFVEFSNLDFFHGQNNNNFFRLYDIPAAPPVSVGVFQHLQFKDKPPFATGNTWGNDLNEVFDRFFISSIPRDRTGAFWDIEDARLAGSLPNPFISIREPDLVLTDELLSERSAQYLFQEGAFNFNSTSVEAWSAVLQGNTIYNWEWTKNKGTSSEETHSNINLESAYFRLPFSGHIRSESWTKWKFPFETYEDELNDADDYPYLDSTEKELIFRNSDSSNPIKDWRPASALGNREIDSDMITELAEIIVDKLIERSRPLKSFKEFANSGLLQEAIDETAINTIDPAIRYTEAASDQRIPRNAPAFLSQADILSALSPAMCARSDTFRIRAVGGAVNSLTDKTVYRAYCEAIVQRIPERLDGDASRIMENSDGFGRRFKIIDIQWLDPSQL